MNTYQWLSILVYILIALILVCEIVLAVKAAANRRRVALLQPGHPELANANQFAFSIGWLGALDSIVIVTFTRRICAAYGLSAAFASLPVIVFGIGSVSGIMLYRPLRNHVGTRSIVSFSYLLYALAAAACLWCADRSLLIGICLAKLAAGVAAGLLNAVMYRLPSLWQDNDEGIRTVTADTENGLLSAGILGVFAGGYLAEYVSFASIYALQAVSAACFLLIGRRIFIKKASRFNHPDREQKKSMSSRAYGFMLKPAMISLLLIFVLYNGIALSYKQIAFPLISDDLGCSEQTMSDIYIVVRCLIWFSFRFIEKMTLKIDSRRILVWSQLAMGWCFLLFIWWDSYFLWAAAMLLITGILCKLIKTHGTVLWNQELYRQQIKAYYANPPLMALSGAVSAVAPGVLSFLLSLEVRAMGAVMGIFGVGFTLCYGLVAYRQKKTGEKRA